MKRSLTLGLTFGLLALNFAAFSIAPAEAHDDCGWSPRHQWQLRKQAMREYRRQLAAQQCHTQPVYPAAQYAYPYGYSGGTYQQPYYPAYPAGGGGSGFLRGLLGLF